MRVDQELGSEPVMPLLETLSMTRFVRVLQLLGSVPVRLLNDKSMLVSAVSADQASGKGPCTCTVGWVSELDG